MSQFDNKKAAALKYDGGSKAPVVVAAGSGYVAQKIIEVAQTNDVPVYQDNSLASLLSQLQVGSEIPPELYQAIVEIYVYFLKYVPDEDKVKKADYRESSADLKPSPKVQPAHIDVVSKPEIKIEEVPELPKEKTFTLDELRAENESQDFNVNLLEDLLEDF